ncbi:Eco57I restriction-modification methylase domain-containing protein [Natrialbaceae archaeon AArc-T1-2]|uniref:Eco57I restriction-modification methylase domain-containing protein n=1 Tax=Natrialbaceae archaeon AArc-T1-2 TaxID=3053904 RepID=UPI00255AA1F7|nr:N-6 DNA methylase [Natrialbaceae archaeon AArc-T1-2]WIV66573.1 N-6 DNA methylase [Natrialbaceae archaeon AArc-T1-2]
MSAEQLIDDIDADRIESLADRYQSLSKYERAQMNEATIRQQYINPLIRALGWDTTSDQVLPEQRTLTGDADYALSLNGREQFFIEAKRPAKSLDDTRRVRGEEQSFAVQAIDYAWHQGCDWAVLTNFEELRLYFSHVPKDRVDEGLVFELSVDEYATEDGLEKLSKISKAAVRNGSLDALERTRQRDTVTDEILNVLSKARIQLTTDVHESHPELSMDELREGVQRILDRLVVMRVAEDRSIIPRDTLLKMTESWEETTINRDVRMLVRDLKNAFRDFDSVYNSELFAEHPCENFEIDNEVLQDVIEDLYEYNFSHIDADVLGSIYEDYLGHAIEDQEDDQDLELISQQDERKEGGVYYTPVPVVEYIVEATLGERLDSIMADVKAELDGDEPDFEAARKHFDEIEDIRFLDVTCGSGSFLIKAYDLFESCYDEFKGLVNDAKEDGELFGFSNAQRLPDDYRQRILRNNIYGVDLDYQATEIASVNLLLKALKKDEKLPTILEDNIKQGNSLLNGSPDEVADVMGISEEEAEELGALDWENKFDDVFEENGGFDVIAGNPPWGADIDEIDAWLESEEEYDLAVNQYDSYELLIELGDDLLTENGTLGFIIPDSIFNEDSVPLRRWLVDERQLDRVHKLGEGVFPDVWAATAIVQYTIADPDPENEVEVSLLQKEDRETMMGSGGEALGSVVGKKSHVTLQKRFQEADGYTFDVWASEEDHRIMEAMTTGTVDWSDVLDNGRGDEIGKDGEVMKCPYCMEWDTFPQSRAKSKGGGYYSKTCTHCGEEYEFEEAVTTKEIIQPTETEDCDLPIYFGEHVSRYRTEGSAFIDADIDGIGLKDDWRFEPPKLLIREAGVGFYATVDYTDARCLKSVMSFRPLEDPEEPYDQYDLEYFLGFLNTRAMLYYYAKRKGIVEWQSYPRHPQSFIMSLPIPAVDFDDEDEVEAYEEFVELVREAIESDGKVDEDLDWEIEKRALDLYGIQDENRPRIWNELKELQRLRIVRELFPDGGDEDDD